jgi:hypothetical protein
LEKANAGETPFACKACNGDVVMSEIEVDVKPTPLKGALRSSRQEGRGAQQEKIEVPVDFRPLGSSYQRRLNLIGWIIRTWHGPKR